MEHSIGLVTLAMVFLYGVIGLFVWKTKKEFTVELRRHALTIMPALTVFLAIIFLNVSHSSIASRFEESENTEPETRIVQLERHIKYLEIRIDSERNQMFILLAGMGAIYLIALWMISFAIYPAKPEKLIEDEYSETHPDLTANLD